jgi:nitroreductase
MDKFLEIIKESKKAKTNYPVNEMALKRWSPRSFKLEEVDDEKLASIFEAARWSASAFNEQPWRFIIGKSGDESFKKIFDTLVEFNQNWTKNASVLVLNIYKKTFSHNSTPNATAAYDLGQAVSSYVLEAVNQGLVSHQMSGFDAEKAAEVFQLGDDFVCVSVTAIGHLDKPDALPEDLMKIELQNRFRKPLEELVFTDQLGQTPLTKK